MVNVSCDMVVFACFHFGFLKLKHFSNEDQVGLQKLSNSFSTERLLQALVNFLVTKCDRSKTFQVNSK